MKAIYDASRLYNYRRARHRFPLFPPRELELPPLLFFPPLPPPRGRSPPASFPPPSMIFVFNRSLSFCTSDFFNVSTPPLKLPAPHARPRSRPSFALASALSAFLKPRFFFISRPPASKSSWRFASSRSSFYTSERRGGVERRQKRS
eukprot:30551-Pelagococcus_subviridis.AAC.6